MNDQELDHAVARIALVTDDEIAEWMGSADHEGALATLMAAPDTPDHDVVVDEPVLIERRASRSRWTVIAGGAAAAVVAAIAFVGAGIGEGGDGSRAWAAPLVAFAEGSPLLLIDHDSWPITRAHDDGTVGEMTFSNGSDQADLRWQPASGTAIGEDRFSAGVNRGQYETPAGDVTVVEIPVSDGDAAASLSTLPSTLPAVAAIVLKPIRFNAHWSSGDQAIELDATVSNLNEFVDLLNRLKPVDVDTWLSAMPPVSSHRSTNQRRLQVFSMAYPCLLGSTQGCSRQPLTSPTGTNSLRVSQVRSLARGLTHGSLRPRTVRLLQRMSPLPGLRPPRSGRCCSRFRVRALSPIRCGSGLTPSTVDLGSLREPARCPPVASWQSTVLAVRRLSSIDAQRRLRIYRAGGRWSRRFRVSVVQVAMPVPTRSTVRSSLF